MRMRLWTIIFFFCVGVIAMSASESRGISVSKLLVFSIDKREITITGNRRAVSPVGIFPLKYMDYRKSLHERNIYVVIVSLEDEKQYVYEINDQQVLNLRNQSDVRGVRIEGNIIYIQVEKGSTMQLIYEVEKVEVPNMQYITEIDGWMWEDKPYTKKEKVAYESMFPIREYGRVLKWDSAMQYCRNLTLGGYDDWALPTKDQLVELYSKRRSLKSIDSDYFGDTYWSSSTLSIVNSVAWIVGFDRKYVGWGTKSGSLYVRCVRKVKNVR